MVVGGKHQNFPNYWHSSDYMQHSIIGPVVVHESEVVESGIYAVTPRVTNWEAPGPIAPDEHILPSDSRETTYPSSSTRKTPTPTGPCPDMS